MAVDDVNLSNADGADFARDALLNDRVELRVLAHVATKIRLFNLPSPPLQVHFQSFFFFLTVSHCYTPLPD